MEGKRFGAGLVAGLVLGLVIVTTSSGFMFGSTGSSLFSPFGGAGSSVKSAATSTTATTSQPASPPSQSASNSTLNGPGHTTTTTTTGSSPAAADTGSANGLKFSSSVESISQQPILTNAITFLPVLFAFLLGAFLYRASTKREAKTTEEAK